MITVLLSPEAFALDDAKLEGDPYRHLFRARRLAVGARLRVVDGRGAARWARVAEVDDRQARLRLEAPAPSHEPDRRVELLVASLRKERASWLVEKATELGVAAVRFLHTERAPREFGESAFGRFRRVTVAAVEQSQRARLPELTGMHPWGDLPGLLATSSRRWFLDPAGAGWAGVAREMAEGSEPTALLVGPEGGWDGSERDELLARGCRPLSLGPRILRVETAAVTAAALVLCR